MSTVSSFKSITNKHDVCRGNDCMNKFCKSLRQHAMKILTNEQQWSYENTKICHTCKEKFDDKHVKDKKDKEHCIVRNHCRYTGEYWGAAHSICNLKYSIWEGIVILFHNGSNYDYRFIIKKLADEFAGQFTCFGENTE